MYSFNCVVLNWWCLQQHIPKILICDTQKSIHLSCLFIPSTLLARLIQSHVWTKNTFTIAFIVGVVVFFLTKIENGIDSISSWHNMIARSPTWNYLTLIQFRVIHMTWKFQRWHLLRFLLFIIMLKWNAESKHLSQRKSGKEKKNRPI